MKAQAGMGTILCGRTAVEVAYDLVQCPTTSRNAAEGQVFGDADALREAYLSGACSLRLEGGRMARIVMLDCHYSGAADIAVRGEFAWD